MKVISNILIVDYGMGNLNSVARKLSKIGVKSFISSNPIKLLDAEKIILPGVGHFKQAVDNLKSSGLWSALNIAVIENKTPILGICLGLQLMANHSQEGDSKGFGWLDADVVRFRIKNKSRFKVPHMGWNTIRQTKPSKLFEGEEANQEFYFVHTFHINAYDKSQVLNYTHYEYEFPSAMEKENIYGVQYHPEKSHEYGENILMNFAEL